MLRVFNTVSCFVFCLDLRFDNLFSALRLFKFEFFQTFITLAEHTPHKDTVKDILRIGNNNIRVGKMSLRRKEKEHLECNVL